MSLSPDQTRRDDYFETDHKHQAVDALEMTASFLEAAGDNQDRWKWEVIALHNAVQAFMVLALRGGTNATVLTREARRKQLNAQGQYREAQVKGDEEAAERALLESLKADASLATFMHLYDRIKSSDHGMMQFCNSKIFTPRPPD